MASTNFYVAASRFPTLRKLIPCHAAATLRQMASAARQYEDGGSHRHRRSGSLPYGRRRRRRERGFFPQDMFRELWDPFFSSRNLEQMLDTVDRVFDKLQIIDRDVREEQLNVRIPWDVTRKADAYHLRVDMPGLGKDDVNVTIENRQLIIKGELPKEEDDKWSERSYGNYFTRVTLPQDIVLDQIKAEVQNGVLNIVIPKIKEKAKSSIITVHVD